jgi:flagellar motor switch protein FliN/FliY
MLRASAAPHVLTVGFTVADVSARLVLLVPNAFVVRMDRALEAQTTEYTNAPLGAALRSVPVRVWAELGRSRMPAGTSLDLPTGSVVELDREVEDPVDLYVDGQRFATGRLRVAEDGSLQLEVEQVLGLQRAAVIGELAPPSEPAVADASEPDVPDAAEPDVPDAAEPVVADDLQEVPQAEPEIPTESKEV